MGAACWRLAIFILYILCAEGDAWPSGVNSGNLTAESWRIYTHENAVRVPTAITQCREKPFPESKAFDESSIAEAFVGTVRLDLEIAPQCAPGTTVVLKQLSCL